MPGSLRRYLGRNAGLLTFLVTVLAAYASSLGRPDSPLHGPLAAPLYLLGLAYFLVGGLGWPRNARFFAVGIVCVGVFSYFAISERASRAEVERLAAELQAANQKLREHAAQVEELATAKERNRLAREIHDSLGHYLTVINMQLEAAQVLAPADPERARAALGKAQSLAQEGLADVRRSVAALRADPVSGRPLTEAMAELVKESQAAGLVTR